MNPMLFTFSYLTVSLMGSVILLNHGSMEVRCFFDEVLMLALLWQQNQLSRIHANSLSYPSYI